MVTYKIIIRKTAKGLFTAVWMDDRDNIVARSGLKKTAAIALAEVTDIMERRELSGVAA